MRMNGGNVAGLGFRIYQRYDLNISPLIESI